MDVAQLGLDVDLVNDGDAAAFVEPLVPGRQPEPDWGSLLAGLHVGVVARPLNI